MTSENRKDISDLQQVEEILQDYKSLGDNYENPPRVELALITQSPPDKEGVGERDIAATTAYQCYSPGITKMRVREDERALKVADSTLAAGHHTTRLHANYTFLIEGTSRSSIHDERHQDPFYNTEQQSQRYVEANEGNYIVPSGLTPEQRKIYKESAEFSNKAYFELLEPLRKGAGIRVRDMYPEKGWVVEGTAKRLEQKSRKISQEVARYVLPIAQKTTYYHTLSALQLIRHFRASQMPHVTDEGRFTVAGMISEIAKVDPSILEELRKPISFDIPKEPINQQYITLHKQEFDDELNGRNSKLSDTVPNIQQRLADGYRNVNGIPSSVVSDSRVLERLMDPSQNKLLADVYDVGMLDPTTAALRQVNLAFKTKLSHTADSQRQRHRRTPGATPPIETSYDGKPDYMTPMIIKGNPDLNERYQQIMDVSYKNVERALDAGIPSSSALLLLPNAHTLRVEENGDLFDWIHRWKQRLCYLAQEEIFFISVEQVEQVGKLIPEAKNVLLAPCGIRQHAGVRPRCPEGDRWCGKPVYNWDLKDYSDNRLV